MKTKKEDVVVRVALLILLSLNGFGECVNGEQPLSKIAIHRATLALMDSASIKAHPFLLGLNGEDTSSVVVEYKNDDPSNDDWVAVFSPAKFNGSNCYLENDPKEQIPYICTSPIKYQFANFSDSNYAKTGKASLKLQLINQRSDFSFALFRGGLSNPQLLTVSNSISFVNPKSHRVNLPGLLLSVALSLNRVVLKHEID